jgi:branched-subunit amino acid aminotransferase/4-amino-4-deoxychorismate lyase
MSALFVNNNGKILPAEDYSLKSGNRGYLYGDGVFESIRVFNGKVINLNNHISRMLDGAKALKMRIPVYYTTAFFGKILDELLLKSEISGGAKVRISLDRMSGGNFVPEHNEATFFVEVLPMPIKRYELNTKGFEVDMYMDMRKARTKLSNYKTKNGLLYVMAGLQAQEKGIDELLINNDLNQIIESCNSNVFVVSNGVLYTPSLDDGCLAGTMRMQVINLALENGFKVYECTILPQNLLSADEVFLTNAIKGITWVVGYRTKRYYNNVARQFVELLNKYWENKIAKAEGENLEVSED